MKKLILVVAFLLFCSTVVQAVQVKLTLESYPPATLPTVSKIIDVPDPNDQLEISRQAMLFALSPEGWGLESYGGIIRFNEPPSNLGHLYSVVSLIDVSGILGFELNAEAIEYGLSQSGLEFHTDEWVGRLSHDFCESTDNYGVISGIMGGVWQQCAVAGWGEFRVTPVTVTSIVVPNNLSTTEGNIDNGFPFNIASNHTTSLRYQQVYDASQFSSFHGPQLITKIAFRPDGTQGSVFLSTLENVQIDLSTTNIDSDTISALFASNIGADNTTVHNGALSLSSAFTGPTGGPKDFDIIINLQTPFIYNPDVGNLLLDVWNFNGGTTAQMDAQDFIDSTTRVYAVNDVFSHIGTLEPWKVGLITQFTMVSESEPNIIISSATYDFGSINIGNASTPQTFTISNTGDAGLVFDTIGITGTDASEFDFHNDICSAQIITPSDACTLDVTFLPSSAGAKSATLSIPSNDPDTPVLHVQLSGIGIDPSDVDDDGDGFTENERDCDDSNPDINPDACDIKGDDIDQNCDGVDRTKGKPCPDIGGSDDERESICDDGLDNDGDGLTDCDDRDCRKNSACSDGGGSNKEICDDGVDNDGDGKIDCADKKDCGKDPACTG